MSKIWLRKQPLDWPQALPREVAILWKRGPLWLCEGKSEDWEAQRLEKQSSLEQGVLGKLCRQ